MAVVIASHLIVQNLCLTNSFLWRSACALMHWFTDLSCFTGYCMLGYYYYKFIIIFCTTLSTIADKTSSQASSQTAKIISFIRHKVSTDTW